MAFGCERLPTSRTHDPAPAHSLEKAQRLCGARERAANAPVTGCRPRAHTPSLPAVPAEMEEGSSAPGAAARPSLNTLDLRSAVHTQGRGSARSRAWYSPPSSVTTNAASPGRNTSPSASNSRSRRSGPAWPPLAPAPAPTAPLQGPCGGPAGRGRCRDRNARHRDRDAPQRERGRGERRGGRRARRAL